MEVLKFWEKFKLISEESKFQTEEEIICYLQKEKEKYHRSKMIIAGYDMGNHPFIYNELGAGEIIRGIGAFTFFCPPGIENLIATKIIETYGNTSKSMKDGFEKSINAISLKTPYINNRPDTIILFNPGLYYKEDLSNFE